MSHVTVNSSAFLDVLLGPGTPCARCARRIAVYWWTGEEGTLALIRGMAPAYCEICAIEEQLHFARRQAELVPVYEQRLLGLIRSEFLGLLQRFRP